MKPAIYPTLAFWVMDSENKYKYVLDSAQKSYRLILLPSKYENFLRKKYFFIQASPLWFCSDFKIFVLHVLGQDMFFLNYKTSIFH